MGTSSKIPSWHHQPGPKAVILLQEEGAVTGRVNHGLV